MDALGYALGAVLIQLGKPIAYHSETFLGVVQGYSTYDKEMYALVQAVKHCTITFLGRRPLCI